MNARHSVRFSLTSSLDAHERAALMAFGASRGVEETYLAPRLDRYPWIARATTDGALSAFILFERHTSDDRALCYLGPLVSRGGAHALILKALVRRLLSNGAPFWCGAEVENPRIFSALATLLPRSSYRGDLATCQLDERVVRVALTSFSEVIAHVHGFDPETLTSSRDDRMIAGGSGHYSWLLFGWDGTALGAKQLNAELSDARMGSLRRARVRRVA